MRSARTEPLDDDWDRITATILLDAEQFGPEVLWGLAEFSHVEVVYLFDRVDPEQVQMAARHPLGNPAWPRVGIFAQRAKARPNRLGVSACRLLQVQDLTVTVHALDAIDGTPVVDLKPYRSVSATRGEVRQPAWLHELMANYWETDATTQHWPGHPVALADRPTARDPAGSGRGPGGAGRGRPRRG